MNSNQYPVLAGQPADSGGLVFDAPWQAKSFSMAVNLHERGFFSWREWTDTLCAEIARYESGGGCVEGDMYYRMWQQALEKLVMQKLSTGDQQGQHSE